MKTERHKDSLEETVKNAASGYGVIVLTVICFILFLSLITIAVRIIVTTSTGAGV